MARPGGVATRALMTRVFQYRSICVVLPASLIAPHLQELVTSVIVDDLKPQPRHFILEWHQFNRWCFAADGHGQDPWTLRIVSH